jgi:hypothetical protein
MTTVLPIGYVTILEAAEMLQPASKPANGDHVGELLKREHQQHRIGLKIVA